MKVKVIVFDLDDTLFDELDYVRSGLLHVSEYLATVLEATVEQLYQELLKSMTIARSHIFDRVLKIHNSWTEKLISECVARYRTHTPNIELSDATKRLISSLAQEYSLYIVTDGHADVQRMKLQTLGLSNNAAITDCYATYALGEDYAKPSPKCFELICEREQCNPVHVVYIADNPDKDFIGIKPLGFRTIRVMQGQHSDKQVDSDADADVSVRDLVSACELLEPLQ